MRINKIRAKGLLRFVDPLEIDLEALGNGLIAFVGANGSGKTSALEAIPAALWGDLPSRSRRLSLYDRCHGRDAYLELELFEPTGILSEVGQYTARVVLDAAQRKSEFYLSKHGTPVVNGKEGPYREAIERLAGTRDLFLASVFAAQNKRGAILSLSRAERKVLFAELLGLERLGAIAQAAAARANDTEKALQGDRTRAELLEAQAEGLEGAEAEVGECTLAIDEAATLRQAKAAAQEAHQGAIDAIADQEAALASARRDFRDVENETKREETARRHADQSLRGLEARERADEIMVGRADEIRSAVVALPDLEDELAKLLGEEATIEGLIQSRDGLEKLAGLSAPCRLAIDPDVDPSVGGKWEPADRDGGKDPVDLAGTCPLLARSREAGAELELTLEGIFDLQSAERGDRLTDLAEALPRARNAAALSEALEAAEARAASHAAERTRIREQLEEALAAAGDRVPLSEAAKAVDDAEKALPEREERDRMAQDLALARREVGALDKALEVQKRQHARAEAQVDALLKAAEQAETIRDGLREHEIDLEDWALLAEAFGPQGIPALLIDAAGPEVATIANDLLEATWSGRFSIAFETLREKKRQKGEYQEVFDIRVFDDGVGREAEDLSGGEQAVLSEAIAIAVAIYHGKRSGARWRQLFRDETAGALDPEAALNYVYMLRRALEVGEFAQVVFVAHQSEVWQAADSKVFFENGTAQPLAEGDEWLAAV